MKREKERDQMKRTNKKVHEARVTKNTRSWMDRLSFLNVVQMSDEINIVV